MIFYEAYMTVYSNLDHFCEPDNAKATLCENKTFYNDLLMMF